MLQLSFGINNCEQTDTVVASAKSNGLKLIVALTNNWSDYGGMDVYVKQANIDHAICMISLHTNRLPRFESSRF